MLPKRVLLSTLSLPCGTRVHFGFAFRPIPGSGLSLSLKSPGWMKRKSSEAYGSRNFRPMPGIKFVDGLHQPVNQQLWMESLQFQLAH
jgi:hypothetical protein